MKHKITIEFDDPSTVTVSSETKPSHSHTIVALTHSLAAIIQKCVTRKSDQDLLRDSVIQTLRLMLERNKVANEG
jgi:hypothetical protein